MLFPYRPVTAMKWLPADVDYYKHPSFTVNKLIVGTEDGNLLCLDQNGKLYAGGSIDTAILSLDTDGRIIVAGCQDGSIRVWIMSNGQMQLIHKYAKAHSGGVTAISLGKAVEDVSLYVSGGSGKDNGSSANALNNSLSDLMVSGSDDCSIRIWRIWYDQ